MGILDRLRDAALTVYDDVTTELNRNRNTGAYDYRTPNAQADTTPAQRVQPAHIPNLTGLPLDRFATVTLQSSPLILNQNYGFETGVAPWTAANGAALSQSNAWSYQGSYAALFTGNGATANPGIESESTIPVTGSTSYTASAELYSPQGWADVQVEINWYTSGGVYISTSSVAGTAVPANVLAGTLVSITATSPSNAAFAQIIVQMTGTPASTVQMYADLAQLNPGSTPSSGLGSGTCQLGPQIVREQWQPQSVAVAVATNVNEAACTLSLGSSPQSSTMLGQTSKGSSGSTAALGQNMVGGYLLIATWTGGDPGSLATLRVIGTRSIGPPA